MALWLGTLNAVMVLVVTTLGAALAFNYACDLESLASKGEERERALERRLDEITKSLLAHDQQMKGLQDLPALRETVTQLKNRALGR